MCHKINRPYKMGFKPLQIKRVLQKSPKNYFNKILYIYVTVRNFRVGKKFNVCWFVANEMFTYFLRKMTKYEAVNNRGMKISQSKLK